MLDLVIVTYGTYTIEFYEEDGRSPVERWMESELTDVELAALLSALEHVLSHRGVGVCGTEWGKQLGGGLFEFRIRHTAGEIARMHGGEPAGARTAAKVLLRVFCHAYGAQVVLLLNGYNKAADPSERRQQREIGVARKRLARFRASQARTQRRR
jgi:hypothetical protein